jgi:AraC family transcriptional regulator of adaptative response / DNA-3-methyladenine glycosylase II
MNGTMKSREDIYYQAVLARDARFDGKFFTGVMTTGIYCRPICPAQPKRKNVEFFSTALAAEKAGYRPCLRCRPESAPLSPAWIGKTSTVQRALRLIANNALMDSNEDRFAEQLGVSARHLRRLFESELGRTPKQIHDSNRIGFAKKLVAETNLSITDIVSTSGYSSIRRFNDAFKERFQKSPSSLRNKMSPKNNPSIELTLSYRPPLDWDSLLKFYHSHEIAGVEKSDHESYERVFRLNDSVGAIRVTHDEKKSRLLLKVHGSEPGSLYQITQRVRQMFDLDSDPIHVENVFSDCEIMSRLSAKYPGLRIPRGWDPYETAIGVILGQLVSVKHARGLRAELVAHYGERIKNPLDGKDASLFPTPEVLATEPISKVKTTRARRETIRELSRWIIEKKIHFNSVQDTQTFRKELLSIKGIGPWTADVICLRSLGDPDAFPGGDLILNRALKTHPRLNLEMFSPWRAYVAVYLWKEFA